MAVSYAIAHAVLEAPMSFIKVIHPESATGPLARIYGRVAGPGGQVDNVLQIHSLRPHSLEGHMALYKAVLHHTGNQLPLWFLESIGVLVSRLNECGYCAAHHAAGLRRHLRDDSRFESYERALSESVPGEPFTEAEQVALKYAAKLTRHPGAIAAVDIELLRNAGYSDGEILEINQVAAYFSYANRTVSGLGVNVDGEVLGLSPEDDADLDDWSHA